MFFERTFKITRQMLDGFNLKIPTTVFEARKQSKTKVRYLFGILLVSDYVTFYLLRMVKMER